MASNSAPTTPSPNDRYFCHRCVREVDNINQDAFTCPFCNQGFLEQLPSHEDVQDEHEEEEDRPGAPAAADFNEFFRNIALPLLFPGAVQQRGAATQQTPTSQSGASGNAGQQEQGRQRPQPQYPLEGFLQNLLEGLGGGGGAFQVQVQFNGEDGQPHFFGFPMPPLHGNPGDYAWGPGGLDEIVTRLLNQFEGGAPPLTEEQIRDLPQAEISQEQVEKRLQCTVCMDDFKLQEKVRRLTCGHHFHEACIIPWLSRHNSCPVCRKAAVATETTTTDGNNSSGSSGSSGTNTGTRPTQSNPSQQQAWDVIEELD